MNNIFKKITSIILILVITSMSITVSGLSPDSIFSSETVTQSTVSSSDNENLNQNPESTEPESENTVESESDIDAITCDLIDIIKKYDVKKPTNYNIDIERSLIKENGTYYIEMNLYAQITGDSCSIGDSSNEILIKNDDYSATLNTQNNTMFINDYEFAYLSAPLKYENNQYYFPLQDVAEGMGYTVNENESEFTLTKTYETKRILVKTKNTIQETQSAVAMAEISDNLYALQYKTRDGAENALEHFKSADNVQYCEPDSIFQIASETTEDDDNGFTSWGADPMGVESYQNYLEENIGSENLDDIVVAVLDTGIDTDYPWFENRIAENGKDFTGATKTIPYEDDNSHGTHVSGIICDLTFNNVKILPIKILNYLGYGTTSQILSGINYIIEQKQSGKNIRAINMSFGSFDATIDDSSAFNEAITNAYNNGILSIVAAGNDSSNSITCTPANVECAITVAAIGKDESGFYTPSWSNFGNIVDISAPGVDIESAKNGGGTVEKSGTSMATPHVVAAAALLCSNKNVSYTLPQIEDTLKAFSIDLGSPGHDKYFGSGMVCLTNTYLSSLGYVAFSNTISDCTEPFQLTLSHPEPNVKIYYTLDGSTPSNLNGTLYTEPIRIDSSVYVKSVAYVMNDNGEITKRSMVHSMIYCFDNQEPISVFEVSDSGMLTNYHGYKSDVVIPSNIKGIPVTGIDDSALYSIRNTVKTIILPDTVTLINDYAFYNSKNLTQVNAPSVTTIGVAAFKNCVSYEYLNDTYFPELLTIGKKAFYRCYNLYSISLSKVTFIDDEAFCTDLEFVLDHLTEVSLPSVEFIGVDCFLRCKYLQKVYLPKVEMICNGAFVRCELTELDLPSLLYIGDSVFSGNLTTVNMPNVLSIGSSCFSSCRNLKTVYMPKVKKIGASAFNYCGALTNLYLLDLEYAGSAAFSSCASLESFYAPNLIDIGVSAFSSCKKLNTVYIPSVINIKIYAFMGSTSLNSITLSDSIQSIANDAFDQVNSQCVFYIYPNTVAKDFVTQNNFKYVDLSQNKNSFKYEIVNNKEVYITGYYSLTNNVEIPSYINGLPVTKICNNAFLNCTEITHLVSSNLIEIETYAFSGCSNLKYISLSNIKTIGERSFNNCTNLESINIKSAEDIDKSAFYGCSALTSVEFGENINRIGAYAFGFDKNDSVIPNFTIHGLSDSVAQEYAEKNKLIFSPLYTNLSSFYYAYCLNAQTNQMVIGITSVDKSTVGKVIIPSSINGLTIELISKSAFLECSFIDEVVLPKTVTYIDNYAFYKCSGLRRINCEYVTQIGWCAFYSCSSLESINLPNVTGIYDYTFEYCSSLESINIPNVTAIYKNAFYECSSLKSINLPNVTSLTYYAFYACSSLESINIPNVTSIYTYAFYSCSSLKSINLPNVTSIGDSAFLNCKSLKIIDIPNVTSIGAYAFRDCEYLESIDLPYVTSIGDSVFLNCKSLKSVSFPNVTSIGGYAFRDCEYLESIDLPKITSIAKYAFLNCKSLKSVSFPNVTSIGDYAFLDCKSLKSVSFPNVTSIGAYVFRDCEYLESIDLPNVTSIGDSTFLNCKSLKSVSFPNVTSIGAYAFRDCLYLESIDLPKLTSIGDYAFFNSKFKNISFPNVTSIGAYAFRDCLYLESIDLPSVTSIGDSAFLNCKSLKSVSFPNVTSIGAYAFRDCSLLENVELPKITTIQRYAFNQCIRLKEVYAPHPTFVDDNAYISSSPNVIIYTFQNSAAYSYAVKKNLKYVLLDSLTPFQTNGILIDSNRNYAYGLSPGIASLDNYFNLPSQFKISYQKTANGFGTGTKVNISTFDITYDTYEIVIFGDISGDGAIDAFDLAMLTSAVNFETEIPKHTAYEVASDTNRDGVIDVFDSGILTSDVNFESSIDQTTAPILL